MTPINTAVNVADLPDPVRLFLELYLSGTMRAYIICATNADGSMQHMYGYGEDLQESEVRNTDLCALIGTMEDAKYSILKRFNEAGNDDD